jgi:hypothetical protein
LCANERHEGERQKSTRPPDEARVIASLGTVPMKKVLFCCGLILITDSTLDAQSNTLHLSIQPHGSTLELSWPGSLRLMSGDTVYPRFEIHESSDLESWRALSAPLHSAGAGTMKYLIAGGRPQGFYRLFANWAPTALNAPVVGGDHVFGYSAAFEEELGRIGQISPQEFAERYRINSPYLAGIDWDPTTAQYWNLFATDPATNNIGRNPSQEGYRHYDFRLNSAEFAVLRQNGFVVTPRLGSTNFAEVFYRLWNDDLPVFISSDSVLQAWHRSYDNMLIELEYFWLSTIIENMIEGMAAQLEAARQEAVPGALDSSLLDADYFLTVARSLFRGSNVLSALGQETRVQATLTHIQEQQLECVTLFDNERLVDFSQFKPRGHYAERLRLERYFQTVMWLGRIDLRVAGPDQDCFGFALPASPRQLGTAIVLTRLLARSGEFENWRRMDRVIQTFVGPTASMTVLQLADLLESAGIRTLADISTREMLINLQERIEEGSLGVQHIRGDAFTLPLGAERLRLPRSFTVFGQKFAVDSWALSKVVFSEILWTEGAKTTNVMRRVPSCFDVAFSVFANDHIVPELVERITTPPPRGSEHMVAWRDGRPYQHNLAAVRNVIDSHSSGAWQSSIYLNWLWMLRHLSAPITDAMYPQAMRTRPWAMKSLNTQLASWTQLRHNTVLYVKPSYTDRSICSYPDGYVEPCPGFWREFEELVTRTAEMIDGLPYEGTVLYSPNPYWSYPVELSHIKTNQVGFLRYFASIVSQLRLIADQELRHEPLTASQLEFVDGWIQAPYTPSGGVRTYTGWYPRLYYRHRVLDNRSSDSYPVDYGATKPDSLVVDVHTDLPDPFGSGDPGGILHQAVGDVHLMMIAIESGPRRTVYAGPVLSHYEFETAYPIRKTNSEWKEDLRTGRAPPHPSWTRSYLVP